MITKLRIALFVGLMMGVSSTALAEDMSVGSGTPSMMSPISVGLLAGYGISLEDGPNIWGVGFGLRGGYNLDAFYLGARFIYYLGEDAFNVWELGAEVGYDLYVAQALCIRPTFGLGLATLTVEIPSVPGFFEGGSESSSEFYIAPGASVLYDINTKFFIGGEARFKMVLAESTFNGFTILANGGMRF